MYALLAKARDIAGDRVPSTSLEIEIAETAKLPTYETSVSAVREITPRMREITFSGGLDRYSPLSPDQFLLVKLPTTGATETSAQAYYTVRRWRPDPGEIDMWFVLHGDQGPLSKWAARAKPGDQVALWGPRSSFDPPPSSTSLLLVADDTGLPAVAAILESSALPGHVIIETLDPGHAVDLDRSAGVSVEWTYRHDSEPGTGTRLLDAVRRLDIDWNDVYAFGAAESRQITSVRRLLRQEQGLPMENVQMTGYWRRPVDGPQTAKEGT
jgi:NADPH-dependent ferric siderophore reductase